MDRDDLTARLSEAGIEPDDELLDALLEEGRHHAERRGLEDSQRAIVERLGVPYYELPRLPGGVDLSGLYELAEELTEEGLA